VATILKIFLRKESTDHYYSAWWTN